MDDLNRHLEDLTKLSQWQGAERAMFVILKLAEYYHAEEDLDKVRTLITAVDAIQKDAEKQLGPMPKVEEPT